MQILIDGVDYSGMVTEEGPVTIQRTLNAPSRCTAELLLRGVSSPVRRARVIVSADDASVLFTGYLATEPVKVFAGAASEGKVYRARITAVSDEWLLDKLGSGAAKSNGTMLALNASSILARLTNRLPGAELSVAAGSDARTAGVFRTDAGAAWSANASAAAGAAYAGYRALGGQVMLQPAGAVTHAFSEEDGSLRLDELKLANVRELTNDVSLSGAEEPAAYVTECFVGDGTTSIFTMRNAAFRPTQRIWLSDRFEGAGFDTTQWAVSDPGSALSLTGAGLTVNGGTGADAVTMLSALDALEIGGRIVVELGSVVFGAGSNGMLSGLYQGTMTFASCFAGFRVRQQDAQTVVVPVLNGAEIGAVFPPAPGHRYTLRLRVDANEMHRVRQRYYAMIDGVVEGFGALGGVDAGVNVVFEVRDEGISSATPMTVLYDSFAAGLSIAASPATCAFAAVNAVSMVGSVGAVLVTQDGPLAVTSVTATGVRSTRLIGVAGDGADVQVSYGTSAGTNGEVTFFAGRVPEANERITVSYRTERRAIARVADVASVAAEAASGASGTSRWLGKVLQPVARNSEDCEAAARAILTFSTSRSAAIAGEVQCVNPAADVWPGDVLALTSDDDTVQVLVRSVALVDGASVPETRRYKLTFANDWAMEWGDGLGMRLSESIAADAALPQTAEDSTAEAAVLANLSQLSVTSLSSSVISVDAGITPPSGGGFEVRRRDDAFGEGVDGTDLVLRSPVRAFDIPRAEQVERYFVRMYDASAPRRYSRWSSAVVVSAPVA
ncbi:MAG: hypothetical protein PW792_17520 [Acidobacteriaceae bacterium]|nr:hypothetical protein [Acidobacteriaceae bacterium]